MFSDFSYGDIIFWGGLALLLVAVVLSQLVRWLFNDWSR